MMLLQVLDEGCLPVCPYKATPSSGRAEGRRTLVTLILGLIVMRSLACIGEADEPSYNHCLRRSIIGC